jgi:hypothetical protein
VYFRGERLAKASGHSIQQAEMNAAKEALELSQGLCIGMQCFLKDLLAIHIFFPLKNMDLCVLVALSGCQLHVLLRLFSPVVLFILNTSGLA